MVSYSEQLSDWAARLEFRDLPADVVEATRLRVLDVIGLALAGGATAFGDSLRRATVAMNPSGPARLIGTGESVNITAAAFANGAMAQALEYDDTHNESIVHMSSPSVAAALALSESRPLTGQQIITAIALGSEISCRIGSVAPGQFHRRGFHPTGLFATLSGGSPARTRFRAAGQRRRNRRQLRLRHPRMLGRRHPIEIPPSRMGRAKRHRRRLHGRRRRHRSEDRV
jgi:2-methylcitrate dehydratase PrpD